MPSAKAWSLCRDPDVARRPARGPAADQGVRPTLLNRRELLLGSLASAASAKSPGFRLVDATASAGIAHRHNSGAFGEKFLPETLGAGCAFLDYDNDGWQDILLVNGMDWPG